MATSLYISSLWAETTQTQLWTASSAVCFIIYFLLISPIFERGLPRVNAPKWYELTISKKIEFLKHGMQVYLQGRDKHRNKPYRLFTNMGDMIVLPPDFAHEIRNEEKLSFSGAIIQVSDTNFF